MVIDDGRLVLARSADLEVDDKTLTPIQSLELPQHRFMPSILRMDQQATVNVSVDGSNYSYGGTPLALLNREQSTQRGQVRDFTFTDGQTIARDGEILNLEGDGKTTRKIASLDWVLPACGRYTYCQAYDAPASIQVRPERNKECWCIQTVPNFLSPTPLDSFHISAFKFSMWQPELSFIVKRTSCAPGIGVLQSAQMAIGWLQLTASEWSYAICNDVLLPINALYR